MSTVPIGWVNADFEKVLNRIVGGGTPSKANAFFFKGQIPFMTVKDMKERFPSDTVDHVSEEAIKASATSVVPEDTLIVATRMSLGKVVRPRFETAINQDLKALFLADGISKTFIEHWWRSRSSLIQSLGTGTTVKGVRLEDIRALSIDIPPSSEQKRIADKLDAVLARVDACHDRLDRIPAILKRFRQSVLAAATSGKLTEDWRANQVARMEPQAESGNIARDSAQSHYVVSAAPDSAALHPGYEADHQDALWVICTEWEWTRAEDVCDFITKGTTPSKGKMFEGYGDVPYIKVYNLTFNGRLDFTVAPTFVDRQTHVNDLKRSIVFPGDVLMNIVGPPLGKVSIVPNSYPEWNINQAIARFRPREMILSSYLAHCLMSSEMLFHASGQAKATAGQSNLTLEICRRLPIPLPPLNEQTEIVRRVEALFACVDRLEARYTAARAQVEKLTPATLAKAFRGELVPQDPNDEPASALLERIRAQRGDRPRA